MYLDILEICELNRLIIEDSRGHFVPPLNLANPESLLYVLDAISSSSESLQPYRTLQEKAAALEYYIISRHVFWDANKRTGLMAAWSLLKANGVTIQIDKSAEDLAVSVAKGTADYSSVLAWFTSRTK